MPNNITDTKYKISTKYKIIKIIRFLVVIFILSFAIAMLLFITIHGEKISQIEKTTPIDIEITKIDSIAS
jgi:hypothetical protein